MSAPKAMNMHMKVQALQSKLSHAAKQSLDSKFGALNGFIRERIRNFLKRKYSDKSRAPGGSTAIYLSDWAYATSLVNCCTSTTTVTDKPMGKVVGEPYRGEPDVRFDEGTKGKRSW